LKNDPSRQLKIDPPQRLKKDFFPSPKNFHELIFIDCYINFTCAEDRATLESDLSADTGGRTDGQGGTSSCPCFSGKSGGP
jgi:hypothetical protein